MTRTPCENCVDGWLVVYCTKQHGDRTVRYFKCWLCGHAPAANKTIEPRRRTLRSQYQNLVHRSSTARRTAQQSTKGQNR